MNLHQKLIAVKKSVEYLQKENQGFGFKYVSSSQVIGSLRASMNEHGVLLVPEVVTVEVSDHLTDKGKTWKFTAAYLKYTWINADNPEEVLVCPWYAQGLDDAEKGVGKALTYGEKYFLLKFFNIPTDKDDPDAWNGKGQPDPDPLGAVGGKKAEPEKTKGTPGNPPSGQTINKIIIAAKKAGMNPQDASDKAKKMTEEEAVEWLQRLSEAA